MLVAHITVSLQSFDSYCDNCTIVFLTDSMNMKWIFDNPLKSIFIINMFKWIFDNPVKSLFITGIAGSPIIDIYLKQKAKKSFSLQFIGN